MIRSSRHFVALGGGKHAFWKLYGMGLPDEVLKKLYYQNALRIVPALPSAGFPN